jgi:hypothetical protein
MKRRGFIMKKLIIAMLVVGAAFSGYSRKTVKKISFKSVAQKKLEQKLKSLQIDKIEFADETPLAVFKYLRIICKKVDPKGVGINFVFKDLDKSDKRVTIMLNNVPVMYVIKSICETAGLTYRIDDYAVFIYPKTKKSK